MRDRYYDRKKKVLVVCLAGCAVVSVFLLWRESFITNGKKSSSKVLVGKKKSSSHLSGRCAIVITTGKKSSSCLSGGCAIVITTGKKEVLVVCLAGAG